jgi:hypothetical protein
MVRGLLLFVAVLPTWSTGRALAAGLDDKAAGEVLVTGGIFTYLSQSAFSDTVKQYDSSKESSGKTYADLAGVCYGLGAAGVVTAAIMMVMKEHHSSGSIALAPVVRPDAVGAVIHYTY